MTELFKDGQAGTTQETAHDFSAWTSGTDTGYLSVAAEQPHHGSYSFKLASAPSGTNPSYKKTALTNIVSARLTVRMNTLPDNDNDWTCVLAVGNDASWFPTALFIYQVSGSVLWRLKNFGSGGSSDSTATVSADTTYQVVVERGSSAQKAYIYDSAGNLIETLTIAAGPYNAADSIRAFGVNTPDGYGVYGFTATGWFDCAYADDAYNIGAEGGAGGISIPVVMYNRRMQKMSITELNKFWRVNKPCPLL